MRDKRLGQRGGRATLLHARPVVPAPEINRGVRVRDRHWVATEVRHESVDVEVMPHQTQHLVDLASVEDGLGEEPSVVWEIGPDAEVLVRETLPTSAADAFDPAADAFGPIRLEAFLDPIRWGRSPRRDLTDFMTRWRW